MDKFSVYLQLSKVKAEIDGISKKMKDIQTDRNSNDQQDLEAFRDLQRAEVILSQLRQASQKLNSLEFECKSQIAHKQNNQREIEKQIGFLSQQEAAIKEQLQETEKILKNPKKAAP
jgi:chromosome segregation ATPase